ncbi:hypothetical protein [Puniceibacterium sp. IMCC21224]|uniref:hypothetical protein n=1 Tax=Puniceibacterium sp. IMCC21224 TaxID=1618204 RepID=UPI00065D41A1|nr:hypothetical protein [Puniceibacterium sp. IMCC21224]KMK66035.1 hypothetical protein IMCC21224_11881 [Puniceibacterium sp. IMCC21224]
MDAIIIIASFIGLAALAGIVYPFRPFRKRLYAFLTFFTCFVVVGVAAPKVDTDGITAATAAARAPTEVADGDRIKIPSDPKAMYFVLGIDGRTDGRIEITTRREGPSGTSFAIRLVQCEPLLFGYIADGDSQADLVREPAPEMTELVDGSISDVISKAACATTVAVATPPVRQMASDADATKKAAKQIKLEAELLQAVESGQWTDARTAYRDLIKTGFASEEVKSDLEARMLALVRPLPSSARETNLQGYQFLAEVRPEKAEYIAKIETYEAAIKAARQRAVTSLRTTEDKIEGITWYQHPNAPKYLNSRSTAYLYMGKKGGAGRPWLRMKVQYTGSDWLFVTSVTAWHDGIKESLIAGSFERDNNTSIWEWMDVTPDDDQIEVLRSLATANEAILRFNGDQYHRDVTLSSGDKKAIRDILDAHDALRNGQW